MKNKITNRIALAALGFLLAGCITHRSVTYHDVERVKISFESDAAARLFYETLSKRSGDLKHSESTTTFSIPIVFENEQRTVTGPNTKFNEAVADCDTDKNGVITEQEARIYANHH
jgi:hypothetical protein